VHSYHTDGGSGRSVLTIPTAAAAGLCSPYRRRQRPVCAQGRRWQRISWPTTTDSAAGGSYTSSAPPAPFGPGARSPHS